MFAALSGPPRKAWADFLRYGVPAECPAILTGRTETGLVGEVALSGMRNTSNVCGTRGAYLLDMLTEDAKVWASTELPRTKTQISKRRNRPSRCRSSPEQAVDT